MLKYFWTKLIVGPEFTSTIESLRAANSSDFETTFIDGDPYMLHTNSSSGVSIRSRKWASRIDGKFYVVDVAAIFTTAQYTLLRSAFLAQYAKLKEATP